MTITDTTTPSRSRRHRRPGKATDRKPVPEIKPETTIRPPEALLKKMADYSVGAYALIVTGDCLDPEICDGDYALVAPEMAYERGDFVVLLWKDGRVPSVKRLAMAPPSGWEKWSEKSEALPLVFVEQLNPPQRYAVTTDHLQALHRVVGSFQAVGGAA
jgi:peptidase S24-like protein